MHKSLEYILFALAIVGLWSCSDDEDNTLSNTSVYDFVTLESIEDSGSTFTLQKSGDSDLITYTSPYTFPNDTVLEVGDRMIIKYLRDGGSPYTSGPIDLMGYRYLDNYPQQIVKESAFEDITRVTFNNLKVTSLTRTGHYINLQSELSCQITSSPSLLCMAINEDDADNEIPQVKILYVASKPGENYMTSYASWDISALWNRPTCQGVEVTYTTPEGDKSQTFYK